MIVEITSLAPVRAFRKPAIPPPPHPRRRLVEMAGETPRGAPGPPFKKPPAPPQAPPRQRAEDQREQHGEEPRRPPQRRADDHAEVEPHEVLALPADVEQ